MNERLEPCPSLLPPQQHQSLQHKFKESFYVPVYILESLIFSGLSLPNESYALHCSPSSCRWVVLASHCVHSDWVVSCPAVSVAVYSLASLDWGNLTAVFSLRPLGCERGGEGSWWLAGLWGMFCSSGLMNPVLVLLLQYVSDHPTWHCSVYHTPKYYYETIACISVCIH